MGAERVRSVRSLGQRSVRDRQGLFLAEGPQAVREAVRWRPDLVRDLYVTDEAAQRYADIVAAATAADLNVQLVTGDVLAAMADAQTPQGLLAVCRIPVADLDEVLAAGPRVVGVLAHVRDPGNAGTVIRCADASGADGVVLAGHSVDPYNDKTVRATVGSLWHLPLTLHDDPADVVRRAQADGFVVLAADGAGDTDLFEAEDGGLLDGPVAWLFGNEAWGLTAEDRALADEIVRVPLHGRAESLNLAMAATVCLYASARHRTGSADRASGP